MEQKIKNIEDALNVQKQNGNWNYDEYMFGLANGMIFALALLKDEDPVYLERPEKFLSEKNTGV